MNRMTLIDATLPKAVQADAILRALRREKREATEDEQALIDEAEAAREIIIQVRGFLLVFFCNGCTLSNCFPRSNCNDSGSTSPFGKVLGLRRFRFCFSFREWHVDCVRGRRIFAGPIWFPSRRRENRRVLIRGKLQRRPCQPPPVASWTTVLKFLSHSAVVVFARCLLAACWIPPQIITGGQLPRAGQRDGRWARL